MTALLDPKHTLQRVRIQTEIELLSALHIGDGSVQTFGERKKGRDLSKAARDATKDDSDYATVCRNVEGLPYLPATSLRGMLRAEVRATDVALATRLFGPEHDADDHFMGELWLQDAVLIVSTANGQHVPDFTHHTGIAHAVSINPITGAAADHLLFAEEYVPAGSRFQFSLQRGPCSEQDVQALIGLLHQISAATPAQLGAGGSHGFGHFQIKAETTRVDVLTDKALLAWMGASDVKDLPWQKRTDLSVVTPALQRAKPRSWSLQIIPEGRFVIHDPGHVGREALKNPPTEKQHAEDEGPYPRIEYSRDENGRPSIPGRSLRGLLRHRASRILATLLHQTHEIAPNAARQWADQQVKALFGDTRRQSLIAISRAIVPKEAKAGRSELTFNAVDRFTGGVAGSKLYNARAVRADYLQFEISLRGGALPDGDWWKGLALLVLRDAVEGDLALGWGKAKGLGAFRLRWQGQENWPDTLQALRKHVEGVRLEDWLQALHQHIKNAAQDIQGVAP